MYLRTGYDFLDDFGLTNEPAHTTAPWLYSDFRENLWKTQTHQKKATELDWGVRLWDGSLLTNSKNEKLLSSLKHLLIIGANGVNEEFAMAAPATQQMRLVSSLRIIDYLLMNAARLDLVQFGLSAIGTDDLKGMLDHLASSPSSEDTIYEWHKRVSAYCNSQLTSISENEAREIFAKHPSMEFVSDDQYEDLKLDIAVDDIPKIRAALMKSGAYYGNAYAGFKINTKRLSDHLYLDTLRGAKTRKPALEALSFYPSTPPL